MLSRPVMSSSCRRRMGHLWALGQNVAENGGRGLVTRELFGANYISTRDVCLYGGATVRDLRAVRIKVYIVAWGLVLRLSIVPFIGQLARLVKTTQATSVTLALVQFNS